MLGADLLPPIRVRCRKSRRMTDFGEEVQRDAHFAPSRSPLQRNGFQVDCIFIAETDSPLSWQVLPQVTIEDAREYPQDRKTDFLRYAKPRKVVSMTEVHGVQGACRKI